MPDNKKKKKPKDSSKISLQESYEMNYWCNELNCTKAQLTNAVKEVGHSVSVVKKYLSK